MNRLLKAAPALAMITVIGGGAFAVYSGIVAPSMKAGNLITKALKGQPHAPDSGVSKYLWGLPTYGQHTPPQPEPEYAPKTPENPSGLATYQEDTQPKP